MKKKICREPGCQVLIESGAGSYCGKHIKEKPASFNNAIRYNTELYNTTKWRKLRVKVLKDFPYCYYCGVSIKESRLEVHHIKPPLGNEELFFEESNLITVCEKCHKMLTLCEIKERRRNT